MNLILLFPEDFVEGPPEGSGAKVRLDGRRLDHVREIHRADVGDRLCVGLVNGLIGTGVVLRCDANALEMEVALDREPPAPSPIDLVLAMPRPLVLNRVLIAATSMGVKRIFLINSNRVERSFFNSSKLRGGALSIPLVLGLEQARDTAMPTVEIRTRFKPFVEDELSGIIGDGVGYVAHPEAADSCPRGIEGSATLIVGPEGGFVPHEIDRLSALGCRSIHLGDRILRVETAVPALLARLG